MSNRRAIRILIIALVVFSFFAIKNSLHRRETRQIQVCHQNLKAIEGVKEQYALEHEGQAPASFAVLVPNYLIQIPECPSGGNYTLGDMQVLVMCNVVGHGLPTE